MDKNAEALNLGNVVYKRPNLAFLAIIISALNIISALLGRSLIDQ